MKLLERFSKRLLWSLICVGALQLRAQTYTVLHYFAGSDGSRPAAGLVQGPDGMLYGTTSYGGVSNSGTIFRIQTNGTGFQTLHDITNYGAYAPLLLSNSVLYGTTLQGGSFNSGTYFRLRTDGSGYQVLRNFEPGTGKRPQRLILSDNVIYGSTAERGAWGYGTIFKMNVDGSGHTVIKSPNAAEGAPSPSPLVLAGSTLFWAAAEGGINRTGAICRIDRDGTGFAILKSFTGPDGTYPRALVLRGSTLYGTALLGGRGDAGLIFQLQTDGTGFRTIYHFYHPTLGLGSPGSLFLCGDTVIGIGEAVYHTVFQVNLDGSDYRLLRTSSREGSMFNDDLVLCGQTLYGTAYIGGTDGVVFALTPPPAAIVKPLQSQTAELGTDLQWSIHAAGALPMIYQWSFNGTNLS